MVRYVHPLLDGAPSVLKGFVHLLDGMQSASAHPLLFLLCLLSSCVILLY